MSSPMRSLEMPRTQQQHAPRSCLARPPARPNARRRWTCGPASGGALWVPTRAATWPRLPATPSGCPGRWQGGRKLGSSWACMAEAFWQYRPCILPGSRRRMAELSPECPGQRTRGGKAGSICRFRHRKARIHNEPPCRTKAQGQVVVTRRGVDGRAEELLQRPG